MKLKMTLEAEKQLHVVYDLYSQAERKRDYPGTYFPLKEKANTAKKGWEASYPGAAILLEAKKLRAKASSSRLDPNYCDLDGSLSPQMVDEKNEQREKEREQLLQEADSLLKQANGMIGVEGAY